jgi:hypothetical protein
VFVALASIPRQDPSNKKQIIGTHFANSATKKSVAGQARQAFSFGRFLASLSFWHRAHRQNSEGANPTRSKSRVHRPSNYRHFAPFLSRFSRPFSQPLVLLTPQKNRRFGCLSSLAPPPSTERPSRHPPPPFFDAMALANIDRATAVRWSYVALAFVECLLGTGVVFGFSGLQVALIRDGVYEDLCGADDAPSNVNSTYDGTYGAVYADRHCDAQRLRLAALYSAGAVSFQVSMMGWGFLMDIHGSPKVRMLSMVWLALTPGCQT